MTDHTLLLARTLGLRPPSHADLPFMIEAAAQSAWSTDRGQPIVAGGVEEVVASVASGAFTRVTARPDRDEAAAGARQHAHRIGVHRRDRAAEALGDVPAQVPCPFS